MQWQDWISFNWRPLAGGARLEAPRWLPHPSTEGMRRIELAAPSGQVADWVLPYNDHSRIHVHELADGRLMVHRDQYDPDVSPAHALAHLIAENFLLTCAGIFGTFLVFKALRSR